MNLKTQFNISQPRAVVNERLKEFFIGSGYKLEQEESNKFVFSRGSKLRNAVAFNPLKWKSSVTLSISESEITAQFDIDTSSQLVTSKEEQTWNVFVGSLEEKILSNSDNSETISKELRSTYFSSFKYVGSALLGAIVFAIPSGLIAYITGFDGIVVPVAVAGSLYFMHKRNNKERTKNMSNNR